MPLEVVARIADLNPSNPVGSTDKVQTLDDHIRNIKVALLNDLPNITGPITVTQAEINLLAGVASNVQAQLNALTAGSAPLVHVHSAADLTSGIVPDARFPATLPAVSGALLTNLSAANLTGSIADARLSANVALRDAANTFTAAQRISMAVRASLAIENSVAAKASVISFATNSATRGFIGADGGEGFVTGALATDIFMRADFGSLIFSTDAGTTAILKLDTAGSVITKNVNAQEVGYKGAPLSYFDAASITLVASDAGKTVFYGGSGGHSVTIPASVLPNNSTLIFVNFGAGAITIIPGAGITLYLAGTGLTVAGTRTLQRGGMAFATSAGGNSWIISGAGLS